VQDAGLGLQQAARPSKGENVKRMSRVISVKTPIVTALWIILAGAVAYLLFVQFSDEPLGMTEPVEEEARLFVQEASAGMLSRLDEETYVLTLQGVWGYTAFFDGEASGLLVTGEFVETADVFDLAEPPTAVIAVTSRQSEEEDIIIGSLTDPRYNAGGILSYNVVFGSIPREWKGWEEVADEELPVEFRSATLFIRSPRPEPSENGQ